MENRTNGKAIAALVLGVLSLILLFIPYGSVVGIVLSIVGVILGVQAKKEIDMSGAEGRGMAIAGLVCSIVALSLCVLAALCLLVCAASVASSMGSLY